jgi:hypothetical protein
LTSSTDGASTVPVRVNAATGIVECMSTDGANCYWGGCASISSPPPNLMPGVCGAASMASDSWCGQALARCNATGAHCWLARHAPAMPCCAVVMLFSIFTHCSNLIVCSELHICADQCTNLATARLQTRLNNSTHTSGRSCRQAPSPTATSSCPQHKSASTYLSAPQLLAVTSASNLCMA